MSPQNDNNEELPTLKQVIEQYVGFQLPGLPPLPQTAKNLDKAVAAFYRRTNRVVAGPC